MNDIKRMWIIISILGLVACDGNEQAAELAFVTLKSTYPIVGEDRQYFQDQLQQYQDTELPQALANIWGARFPRAQHSAILVDRRWEQQRVFWDVVMIFDDASDDDSVSSYYFKMIVEDTDQGLEILTLEQSGRCWPDRGHRYFSIEPCT